MPKDRTGLRRLGAAVRLERESAGISQRELARRSGVTRQHLCNLELGRVDPSYSVLSQLARALGVTTSQLVREAEQ